MIFTLLKKITNPKRQLGKPSYFNRSKPVEGNIGNLKSLNQIYDYIRMLDTGVKNYPLAFVSTPNLIIQFRHAKKTKNFVTAQAIIKIKN